MMIDEPSNSPDHSPQTEQDCAAVPRRSVLGWLSVALGAVASAALGVPIVGYLAAAIFRRRPDQWVDLGAADEFPLGETRVARFDNPDRQPWDGEVGHVACYVRREQADSFLVFAINCTHLGCPVSWFPAAGLFLCPCHGGVYYANGDHASGPPPRGLYKYEWKVADGRLLILAGHLPNLSDTLSGDEPRQSIESRATALRRPCSHQEHHA